MSVEATAWAKGLTIFPSSAKFVLVTLCDVTDSSWHAHPSINYISWATGQDKKTVLANLHRLRQMGHIADSGRRVGRTKQVVVYRIRPVSGDIPENGSVLLVHKFVDNSGISCESAPETYPKTEHGIKEKKSSKSTTTRELRSRGQKA